MTDYIAPESFFEYSLCGMLVVPLFNESKRFDEHYFRELVDDLRLTGIGVFFVDDGSTDGTPSLINSFARRHGCGLVKMPKNEGKGNAVRLGMLSVLKSHTDLSFVGFLDGDGAFSKQDVLSLCSIMKNQQYDLLIGSRVELAGSRIERTKIRRFAGRLIAKYENFFILPKYVRDPQSGFKLISNQSIELPSLLSKPFRTKWLFDAELLLRLQCSGPSWAEVPLSAWRDIGGGNLQLRHLLGISRELLMLLRLKRQSFSN